MTRKLWLLLPLLLLLPARLLLGSDLLFFLSWWLTLTILGLAVWPLAARLFPGGDLGYLLAKPLGLALSSFLLWTLSFVHVLPFRRWAVLAVSALVAALCWFCKKGWKQVLPAWQDHQVTTLAAAGELLFGAGLLFWTFARGLKPELDSLEKFMDVGLMNTLWRTDFLPGLDMWLAGGTINYYYYGQYLYTFLAKVTAIRPEISYNLSMATTFAMTLSMGYAIGSALIALARRRDPRLPAFAPAIGGILTGTLLAFGGNGHAFLFDPKSPAHVLLNPLKWLGYVGGADVSRSFWFADSTRFIGYNPETADKTIHEFPYYSFLVADLHAHVINLAIVLLLLALLIRILDSDSLRQAAAGCREHQLKPQPLDDRTWHRLEVAQILKRFRSTALNGPLLFVILLLGISMMGNYWDFAIYFVVSSVVLVIVNIRGYGRVFRWTSVLVFIFQMVLILIPYMVLVQPVIAVFGFLAAVVLSHYLTILKGDGLTMAGAQMIWVFFLAHVLTLPFNISFEPIAKSIALSVNHTPLWQLAILWGPMLSAGAWLAVSLLAGTQPGGRLQKTFPPDRETIEAAALPGGWPNRVIQRMNPADLLSLIFFICAAGLILVPEIVYVVDIYSGDYKRANTMFKFTYQAFVLLSLVWAYAAIRINAAWIGQAFGTSGNSRTAHAGPVRMKAVFAQNPASFDVIAGIVLYIMLIIPIWYPIASTSQWLGEFSVSRYQGLDGLALFAEKDSSHVGGAEPGELAADVSAINWLNENVDGQPVILESFGESYTDYCRISVFTGLPAVLGWETHEWLWRTSKATPSAYSAVVLPRQNDIRTMYTTDDQDVRIALLQKYKVAYVIIGDLERARFSEEFEDGTSQNLIQEDMILELGTVAFREQNLMVIKIDIPGA